MAQVTPRGHGRRPPGAAARPARGARVSTDHTGALHLAWTSLQRTGRPLGGTSYAIDNARYCDAPISIGYEGRTTVAGRTKSMFVDMSVPCRKCAGCRRAKQREWTARAIAELRVAARTWFVTFTFAPHNQAAMLYRARVASKAWASLSESEQFHRVHLQGAREVTLFIKRLKKARNDELRKAKDRRRVKLRYMYVVEPHKSGLPHYHMLLHECWNGTPDWVEVTKRQIQAQWVLGWSSCTLATKSRAYYVCKYISKDAQCRVRASLKYGVSG